MIEEKYVGLFVGFFVGVLIGGAVMNVAQPRLNAAQLQYTECLEVGAPKDNCAERYLLPKEPRT
jgi:hypothetical protein